MPIYHYLGKVPPKRHTIFEKPDGSLYYEQLFGTVGFDGMSSLLYHVHRPTMVKGIAKPRNMMPKIAEPHNITSRLLKGFELPPQDDYLE
ncbi:MAG: homogentisate 1,2-dioxygenase, partial [Cyclobacteriaceae bacterium]|nr:homogentisate 1,2-dioxygenase [Cyclobacteriaceae bacterium]